jgi:ABC-2 type transport system permease protein
VAKVRAGYVLVTRELRRLLRDPAALLSIVVAPLLLAVIAGVSLGAPPRVDATLVIADAGLSPTADLAASLGAARDGAALRIRTADPQGAEAAVRAGDAAAAIIVPADRTQPVRVIAGEHAKIAGEVATSIARTLEARRVGAAGDASRPVVTAALPGRRPLRGIETYGPVAAVFFILFGVGFVSRSLHADRLDGTLSRVLVSPIRPSIVLATKVVIMFAVGLVEMTLVIAGTSLLFGARWGNPIGVALVTLAIVCAGVAIATAIAGITKSSMQSQAVEFAVSMLLVALGGHMVPLRNLPDAASVIARYTPNGAAIDAFGNVAAGAQFGVLGRQFVIIGVFTAIVGTIGVARFRKALVV